MRACKYIYIYIYMRVYTTGGIETAASRPRKRSPNFHCLASAFTALLIQLFLFISFYVASSLFFFLRVLCVRERELGSVGFDFFFVPRVDFNPIVDEVLLSRQLFHLRDQARAGAAKASRSGFSVLSGLMAEAVEFYLSLCLWGKFRNKKWRTRFEIKARESLYSAKGNRFLLIFYCWTTVALIPWN